MASTIYKKWDIVLVDLNPVKVSEIAKIWPCLIVSPEAVNLFMSTVVIVPLTSKPKGYPFRLGIMHKGIAGELCLDYIRSIDKNRIVKTDGTLDKKYRQLVNKGFGEFFGE
jgi:mRNA interferase MazF